VIAMLRNFLEQHPEIPRKDNQRGFTEIQRRTIFRRDQGICQLRIKCDGAKLTWDDWHCDHTTPWTAGGHTTVLNGRAACTSCNLSKGANLLAASSSG
jgi:5-methylcytosine-specific restriction endonuclease McrA